MVIALPGGMAALANARHPLPTDKTIPWRGVKLQPRTTAKKLPWLDGKFSNPASMSTVNIDGSVQVPGAFESTIYTPQITQTNQDTETEEEITREYITDTEYVTETEEVPQPQRYTQTEFVTQRASPKTTTVQASSSVPSDRRTKQRQHTSRINVPSPLKEEANTPSPTSMKRQTSIRIAENVTIMPPSQMQITYSKAKDERRRSSLAPVPAHLQEPETIQVPVQRIEPSKETVIVMPSSQTTFLSGREERRRSSLAPVPAHLEDPVPSSLVIEKRDQHFEHDSPSRVIIKSAELSPTQPVPQRTAYELERVRDNRRLSNAIENLETLVQEAVVTADQHTDRTNVQEVHNIIEDATVAVRKASIPLVTVSPLAVSDSSSGEWSSSDEETQGWTSHRVDQSTRSAPTDKTVVTQTTSATTSKGEDLHSSPQAIDWAERAKARRESKSKIATEKHRLGKLSMANESEMLLISPEPVQPTTRDHTELLIRSTKAEDDTRGRSRRRRGRASDHDGKRHHHKLRRHRGDHSSSAHDGHTFESERRVDSPFEGEEVRIEEKSYDKREYGYGLSVRDEGTVEDHHHTFSLRRHHRRQPIARNWSTLKKRITATMACINMALLGIIVGIYAGEVPGIQWYLGDERHHVILGNVVLYAGLAVSTFITWPLPLLHGRKPYILASLALTMPLQFPQAMVVSQRRSPRQVGWRTGLLLSRACSGFVLGFAYVNFVTVLLDLFGASLQSSNPHQEIVVVNDVRRHGGGMGMWLGIWSWCAIGSLAVGFQIGAVVIEQLTPDWGFYIVIIILAVALVLNICTPETRRSTYRRSVTEVYDRDENFITRQVARGEIKLHLGTDGPLYWFEEVAAGMKLTIMMCLQPGFLILAFYLGWIYTQIVLVIVLLGALLSRDYRWTPRWVGLGVMSVAFGALLAIPLTKAGIFSRERRTPFRTDSMTFQKQVTWSSHMLRRFVFTVSLPFMAMAYTVSSYGRPWPYMVPIVFAGTIGFFSILAIAECLGLIMETFDTCDLQPGVNTRHRLQSMAVQDQRRRTNYSSFPRVSAGIFAAQTLAFIGAAVATEVGGIMTRHIGAQASIGVTAGILLGLTILLTAILWRYTEIQVIPNYTFGTRRDTKAWEQFKEIGKDDWKAVVIGNPSGKMRRMNVLEMGGLSRWTEIRKLNFLIRDDRDKPLAWMPRTR